MIRRRRRDKAVACEGWDERRDGLENFLSASPQHSLSQFNTIEWSSSDEEDSNEKNKNKVTPGIQKIQLVSKRPASKTVWSSNFDLNSSQDLRPLCKRKRTYEANNPDDGHSPLSPPVGRRLAHDKGPRRTLRTEVGSTQSSLTEVCKSDVLQTPKKERDDHEILDSSPIVGSQRHPRRRSHLCTQDESIVPSSLYIDEPSSPVLGSQISVNRQKNKGLKSCASVNQCKSDSSLSVMPSICNARHENAATGERIGTSLCNSKKKRTDREKSFSLNQVNVQNHVSDTSEAEKEVCQISRSVISCKNDYLKLVTHSVKKEKQNLQRVGDFTNSKTYFLRLKDNELEKEGNFEKSAYSIEHIDSQETGHIIEETENSLEFGIISSFPSSENEQERTMGSLEGNDPSISEVSSVPTQPEETTTQAHKTGSEWLRRIQQVTPVKQSLRGNEEGAEEEESAKKKMKKDGLASRLSRLIRSWQSSVQMWSHQMTISSLQCQPSQHPSYNKEKKDMPQDRAKMTSPSVKSFSVKNFQSPGVRNLNALLSSPSSGPSTQPSPLWGSPIEASRKHLQLRILSIGGKLPSNAALCKEIVDDSVLILKDSVLKTENEKNKKIKREEIENERLFVVIFALSELSQRRTLLTNSIAKVYTPWQQLVVPQFSVPVLFTSFFVIEDKISKNTCAIGDEKILDQDKIKIKEDSLCYNQRQKTKKTVLLSWTCQCPIGATRVPSVCNTHQCASSVPGKKPTMQDVSETNPGFSVIKDFSGKLKVKKEDPTTNSILKAIEKCGGVSEMPVTVTVRIHRIISREVGGKVELWECVCQDARGMFCTIRIPNHPLVSRFKELIESGEGSTFTFSHVTVAQRLTNTQNTGLFSFLSSLHASYQSAIKANSDLSAQLKEHITRTHQTYCYCFAVDLKVSRAIDNGQHVALPVRLPDWSLKKAVQIVQDGERGNINVYILYKVDSLLYVINEDETSEEKHLDSECNAENRSIIKHNMDHMSTLVTSIVVDSEVSLPIWIHKSGTVMHSAVLRYVAVWQGKLMVDAYSKIEQKENNRDITLTTLSNILKPVSAGSQSWDLVLVTGTIIQIDEENAYSWPNCNHCLECNISETEDGGVECQNCGQKSAFAGTGYCLEVWIDCGADLQNTKVKVKLFQRTIEKLLSSINSEEEGVLEDEGYDPEILLGKHVGSLVCVVKEVRKTRSSPNQSFRLLQLPY